MGGSTCWVGRCGTTTGSATTSAPTWSSISATPPRCWWSTRRGISRRAPTRSGVQRQYTGTAGKVDNAQVAVYLAYATTAGHGVIDRELYLPQGWLADAERCQVAGVPDRVGFATKPELARVMLQRALDAGVPAGWVTADEAYGGDPRLRGWLEQRGLAYVLAVKRTELLVSADSERVVAEQLAARVPPERWLRISAGPGAKGRRWYAWSGLPLATAGAPEGWGRWLLVRRSLTTGELTYYLCAGPAGLPLALLVPVGDPGHAGLRVPGGGRGRRACPPPTAVGAHPIDLQRDPAPVRRLRRRPRR
jgi:hypothetical protein